MADLRDSVDEVVSVRDEAQLSLQRIAVPGRGSETARAGSEAQGTARAGVEAAQAQGGS